MKFIPGSDPPFPMPSLEFRARMAVARWICRVRDALVELAYWVCPSDKVYCPSCWRFQHHKRNCRFMKLLRQEEAERAL